MSAHAVAAASGCCCAPAPTPCICTEYGQASDPADPLFATLQVSGAFIITVGGTDCCGAQPSGGGSFSGATLTYSYPAGRWLSPISISGGSVPHVEVIGTVSSSVGNCTYTAPCCSYTGCPEVLRTVTHSRLPIWYCAETLVYVPQDVCAGVVCACDEGGIPCGGNCPPAVFDPFPTAEPEDLVLFITGIELRVCPIGTTQAQSWVRITGSAGPISAFRDGQPCQWQGTTALPLSFDLIYVKECRFPGDSVKGTYQWIDYLNGGPPTQVSTFTVPCQPDLTPGGQSKLTRTIIASPTIVVS